MKETIIEKINEWAKKDDNIKSIIIIGSSVRKQQKGDKYSDIDIITFVKNPLKYEKNYSWINQIDKPISYYNGLEVSNGTYVKRIFFENEVAVDITILNYRSLLSIYFYTLFSNNFFLKIIGTTKSKQIENKIYRFTYYLHRGFYFIIDKKNTNYKINKILNKFNYKTEYSFELNEIEKVVNQFWQNAYRMAVKLNRNELFTARIECEHPMKQDLLNLIEFYTKFKNGNDFETWHKGRYIEKWAEPNIVEKLEFIYGSNNLQNSWSSLIATMDLFVYVSNLLTESQKYQVINNPQNYFYKWIMEIKNN